MFGSHGISKLFAQELGPRHRCCALSGFTSLPLAYQERSPALYARVRMALSHCCSACCMFVEGWHLLLAVVIVSQACTWHMQQDIQIQICTHMQVHVQCSRFGKDHRQAAEYEL